MLIKDDKRLYLVSDDPAMQARMIELEKEFNLSSNIEEVTLEAPDVHTSNSAVQDVQHIVNEIRESFNVNDMSKIMAMYKDLSYEAGGTLKNIKTKELKAQILNYLNYIDTSNMNARRRLYEMYMQIRSFIKPYYLQLLERKGYENFKAFINDHSQNFQETYELIMPQLIKRVSS